MAVTCLVFYAALLISYLVGLAQVVPTHRWSVPVPSLSGRLC